MQPLSSTLRLAPSYGSRSVLNALVAGWMVSVVVVATILGVGYGPDDLDGAVNLAGFAAVLLVLPAIPAGLGFLAREWTPGGPVRVAGTDGLIWLVSSLLVWWCVPIALLPGSGPSLLGLALGVIPLAVQISVSVWCLARMSGRRRG